MGASTGGPGPGFGKYKLAAYSSLGVIAWFVVAPDEVKWMALGPIIGSGGGPGGKDGGVGEVLGSGVAKSVGEAFGDAGAIIDPFTALMLVAAIALVTFLGISLVKAVSSGATASISL